MIDKELIELACQSGIDPTQWLEGLGLGLTGKGIDVQREINARLLDDTISPSERTTLTSLILEAYPKTALGQEGTDVLPVEPPQRTPMQDTSLEQEQATPRQAASLGHEQTPPRQDTSLCQEQATPGRDTSLGQQQDATTNTKSSGEERYQFM